MARRTWRRSELPVRYGKYELLERIGFGGMAEVFRARLPGAAGFEKIVVIKRILPHLAETPAMVELFVEEAKLAARAQHRNIVQVFEFEKLESGEYYIAMEHVDGVDLRVLVRDAIKRQVRIPAWFAVHVITEVLSGLSYVHGIRDENGRPLNVVHRDVSPANIFLSCGGDVKLGDFGVAKSAQTQSVTKSGLLKGKVEYTPPEMLRGLAPDARVDVFAAGVVLWELLTQRKLFLRQTEMVTMERICSGEREPPSTFHPGIPSAIDRCVLRAVAADRDERFASARDLQRELILSLSKMRPVILPSELRGVIDAIIHGGDGEARLESLGWDSATRTQQFFGDELDVEVGTESVSTPPESEDTTPNLLEDHFDERTVPEPDSFEEPTASGDSRPSGTLPNRAAKNRFTEPTIHTVEIESQRTEDLATISGMRTDPSLMTPRIRDPADAPADEEDLWVELSGASAGADSGEPDVTVRTPPLGSVPIVVKAPLVEDLVLPNDTRRASVSQTGSMPGLTSFWIRSERSVVSGPLGFTGFRAELDARRRAAAGGSGLERADSVSVSADGERWMDLTTFAQLTGQENLLPRRSGPEARAIAIAMVQRHPGPALGQLARDRMSGRLVVLDADASDGLHLFELHVVEGRPVYIYADAPELQLPSFLVQGGLLPEAQLPKTIHASLRGRIELAAIAARAANLEPELLRTLLMIERLSGILTLRRARYLFDARAPFAADARPFARALQSVLVKLFARAYSLEELESHIEPYKNRRLTFSRRFLEVATDLGLDGVEEKLLRRLAQTSMLESILLPGQAPELSKLALGLVYVFVESGLLIAENVPPPGHAFSLRIV